MKNNEIVMWCRNNENNENNEGNNEIMKMWRKWKNEEMKIMTEK